MLVDLHDADGLPLAVDLTDVKTVEPQGDTTVLHFADGTRIVVTENAAALESSARR